MAAMVTVLMPLPLYYNPDERGVRKAIEDEKYIATAEEMAGEEGELGDVSLATAPRT